MVRNVVLVLGSLVAACAPALIDDGFRAGPLSRGCHTEEDCRKLIDAAARRQEGCDSSGGVSCAAAEKDYAEALAWQGRMQNEQEASLRAARDAIGERYRTEVAQRDAADRVAREDVRAAAAARGREMEATYECKETAALGACTGAGDSEAPRQRCKDACVAHGARRQDELFHGAYVRCVDHFVETNGAAKSCSFPDEAWAEPDRAPECAGFCAETGRKLLVYNRLRAKCCDGTRSPSCTYGTLRSGCCSSHQGLCVEEPPRLEH